MLVGCSTNDELFTKSGVDKKKFDTFAIYGQAHNSLLHHASANFAPPTENPSSEEEAFDYICLLQQEGVESLSIPDEEKRLLLDGINSYKQYYSTRNLMNYLQPIKSRSDTEDDNEISTEDVYKLIQDSYDCGNIDTFEYNSFITLIDYVLANAAGKLSNSDFKVKVDNIINEWEIKYSEVEFEPLESTLGYTHSDLEFTDAQKGALSGVVLNVSKSSLDYWEEEPIFVGDRALPAFVGADIAGAIIGACSSTIGALTTSGKVTWKSVAWGTASGAATSSTGIAGKIGKWISSLF